MQAKENKIVQLLSTSNTQFSIPVYQRNYNWEEKQCATLLKDILVVAENKEIQSHFIGSIVYLHEGVYSLGKKEFSIIDGQQRLTTIFLLLIAIYHKSDEFKINRIRDMVYERYLIDKYMDDANKIKLIPAGLNLNILKKILENDIDNIDISYKDSNMIKNYYFFLNEIKSVESIEKIISGIEKLIYVDIALEKGKDDPQRIFESLNSTGLDLSQGDLIRNFILMDLDRENQTRIYEKFWIPIENNTKTIINNKARIQISEFMRDYLTLKLGKIPNQNKVFEEFKNNYEYISKEKLESELKIIRDYSSIYNNILNPDKEKNFKISTHLRYIKLLDYKVVNPFLMGVYNDYRSNIIKEADFIKIMELLQSYLWRRYICGEPTNALNKIFMNLYTKINKKNYFESLEHYLSKQNFPSNKILRDELKIKPVYKDREKLMYVFERIENESHNEKVDFSVENITIEHIFPQKPNKDWKSKFSDAEYEKMMSLKDTISNLTLTGSNSNLGNKSFEEKRDMKDVGYRDSKLFLNKWIGKQNEWNLNKLDERFNELYKSIINIWRVPTINDDDNTEDIVFYCQGPRGYGIGRIVGEKFVIFKGSRASKFLYDSVKVSNSKIINKLIDKEILTEDEEYYIFNKDYTCSSPSAAAKLILGRSANGWNEWRTYEGELLDSYREKYEHLTLKNKN